MISRKVVLPALLLSLVAGLGVSADAAQAQTAKKKPTASSSGAHRGTKKSKKSSKQRGQKAPPADRIFETQGALAKTGAYTGRPNANADDPTSPVVRRIH